MGLSTQTHTVATGTTVPLVVLYLFLQVSGAASVLLLESFDGFSLILQSHCQLLHYNKETGRSHVKKLRIIIIKRNLLWISAPASSSGVRSESLCPLSALPAHSLPSSSPPVSQLEMTSAPSPPLSW